MPHSLTPGERDRYEKEGFFSRNQVFSPQEIEHLRQATESVHAQVLDAAGSLESGKVEQIDNQKFQEVLGSTIKWEWSDDLRAIRSMEPVHHLEARLAQLVDDPRIWGPCADIIGQNHLSLFSDKMNVKRPGGAPFPWHQEGPYWAYGAEDLEHVVTLIIYLDDAHEDNGCLWVIPGTHRYGALESLKDRGTLGRLYTDVDRLEEKPFPIALPAGSVAWFHRDIVHGSQSNRSSEDRRAFLLAYQPAGLHQWRNGQQRDVGRARESISAD
ncbi:MAG: phytanoyl-CoA dioxygenase family protein [Myxococcota bacterium]|nr:phytanoyl-CoA dioxygenase family protein [Myxococcota bacterium]